MCSSSNKGHPREHRYIAAHCINGPHGCILVFLYYQIMGGLESNMVIFDAILMLLLLTLKA